MSVPLKSSPAVVPKPSLPPGWSCHVSKSVPDKCYYFNRFTGDKTWELGDLLPGHSDNPIPVVPVPGSAQLPIVVGDPHHHPGHHQPQPIGHHPGHDHALPRNQLSGHVAVRPGAGHYRHQPVHELGHATSFDQYRSGHLQSQRTVPGNQGYHQPRWSKLTGPPLDLGTGLGDDVASLEVEELEAMLVEKRRNLQEMARKMSVESNVDSSSGESGFMSLIGREEEGLVGREVSDRQKELTDGLYKDWGKVGRVPVGPPRPKRAKIEFDITSDNTDIVNVCGDGIDVTVEAVGNDAVHANLGDVDDNKNNDSDSDSLDEDSLCGADPDEIAALANLDKKFPAAPAIKPAKTEEPSSVTQDSSSPPELILLDTACQFSPEPSSDEGGDSEG